MQGDGVARAGLDVWGRFAYDVVEQKARERERRLSAVSGRAPMSKPLRLILSGGAGSGDFISSEREEVDCFPSDREEMGFLPTDLEDWDLFPNDLRCCRPSQY